MFLKTFPEEKQGGQINVNKCKRRQNFHMNEYEELIVMFKEILWT